MKKNYLLYAILLLPLSVFSQDISQITKLVTSDRADSDQLGIAIAIDGNYAVVGVDNEDEDASGGNTLIGAGSAYIFQRNSSGSWVQVQKIVASDRASSDEFGCSVAIYGKYLAVGARQEDEDASGSGVLNNSGSVYIFERNGSGVWSETQKIVASDRDNFDTFGYGLSISDEFLVVGSPGDYEDASGSNPIDFAGSAYVFQKDGSGTWNEVQKIVATDRNTYDNFGEELSIFGNYIAVGCPFEDHDASGGSFLNIAGSAYIFEKDIYDTWQEVQKIVADDRAASSLFGRSVSLSENHLAVGASFERLDASGSNYLAQAGAAYVFEKRADGTWQQSQKIVASDRAASDQFGASVDISGGYIAVSAHNEDEDASGGNTLNGAGSAYIFKLNTSGVWAQEQKIVASDRSIADSFGTKVAISGANILVSAQFEDHDASGGNALNNPGSAYVFSRNRITYSSGSWTGGSGASNEPTSADGGKIIEISNGSATLTGDVEASDVEVATGATLTIPVNNTLTVTGRIRLNGPQSIIIESSSLGTGNLLNYGDFSYSTGASIKVERFLHLNGGNFLETYHYIAAPVDNHAKFTDMTDSDLYAYRESDLTWMHHADFTDEFESFNKGIGYAIRYNTAITKSFIGAVNNDNFQVEVTLSDHGGSAFEGFNLLANPYPCSISAESLVTENSSVLGNNIYFWNGVDYATYNTALSSGTAGGLGIAPDGNIALGQAFMVEATTSGTQMVNFTRDMRGTDSNIFYKKASFPQLRLRITSGEEQSDVLLTGHQESSFNSDGYDAKQIPGNAPLTIASLIDGIAYDIESVPELLNHDFELIVTADAVKSITFQITDEMELKGKRVYIEDKTKGILKDITKDSYTTTLEKTIDNERFKLRVLEENSAFRAWVNDGYLYCYDQEQRIEGTYVLSSIDGKTIWQSTSNNISNWSSLPTGVYLLQVNGLENNYSSKIIKY